MQRNEIRNGVAIVRLPSSSLNRQNNFGRLLNYGSFGLFLVPTILGLPKFDMMLSLSTPPMAASAVLMTARLKKSKFLYWCQDIYPDIATVLGVLKKGGFIEKRLEQLNRKLLKASDLVVTPSERMAERLRSKTECNAISITNWSVVSDDELDNDELQKKLSAQLELKEDEIVLMYSGNMGRAHDFAALLDCWAQKAPDRPVHFKFIGDGAKKKILEQAAELGRTNGWRISFSPYLPREQVGAALSLADIHLLAIDDQADGLVFPSKLYGVLQAGKPSWLLGGIKTEVGQWIEAHRTGVSFNASQGILLKDNIIKALNEPEWIIKQAKASSFIYGQEHARMISLKRFEGAVEQVL